MIDTKRERAVLAKLKRAASLTDARVDERRDDVAEVVYEVDLSPTLAPGFVGRVKELVSARGRGIADNEVEAELEALLLPQLRLGVPFTLELDAAYGVDPDDPVLPERALVEVRLPARKRRKSKKKRMKTKKTEVRSAKKTESKNEKKKPDYVSMTDAERKKAIEREEERRRSRRRRAEATLKKLEAGEDVRVGRRGYVRRVHDAKTDRPVWTPTSEGARVMLAMHKVYGKSILNGSALARHLNTKNIRTITGRRFAPNMMTALLRHLGLLRRDGTI